jgi:hypothetical protein
MQYFLLALFLITVFLYVIDTPPTLEKEMRRWEALARQRESEWRAFQLALQVEEVKGLAQKWAGPYKEKP